MTSYEDFTRRVVERFDRRHPKAHVRELTQLKQTGHIKHYISEFLRVLVMVPNLSDARRVYTFIEGLLEPLPQLVKSRKPSTLQEVVTCTRDLQGGIPKTWEPTRSQTISSSWTYQTLM